jgi:formate dehydrogenase (NADP+) beta subunit
MANGERVKLNIDGRDIEARRGQSLLEAALAAGIYIPHLCHHPDLQPIGACRLCIVQIEGRDGLPPSCVTPVENDLRVRTTTEEIGRLRKMAMELMLAGHPADCGTCIKYLNCELQSLKQYIPSDPLTVKRRAKLFPVNTDNPLFVHDPNKCVVCGRCVRACSELRGVGTLYYKKKGRETYIGTAADLPLGESGCRFCGACAEVCPTGSILDKGELAKGKSRKAVLVPCRYTCPAEIDVPRYIRFIREKDYSAALAVVREKVPFPKVLGYVCDHPCEGVCRRGEVNQPVAIRELKLFAAGQGKEGLWENNPVRQEASGKKAAVIGSGPAGLTAAYYLARQGHSVTVMECLPRAGGMLRWGIPEYRLAREVIDSEIEYIQKAGVEIRTGARVESLNQLFEEGYQAVLVAVGTHKGQKLPIPGSNYKRALIGVDFLREANLGNKVDIGRKVVVLGGGNVAFDCARVALRLGAEGVHIACLESRDQMLAAAEEITQGEEEGIAVHPSQTATRILGAEGQICGVEFLDVQSFSFDEDQKLQIETRENSAHVLEADSVIFAIGQRPDIPAGFGLSTVRGDLIEMDPYTLATSREGVFAAGDAVNGTSSGIKSIASGRKVAIAIDRFLGGSGNIDQSLAPRSELNLVLRPVCDFARLERYKEICPGPDMRRKGFCHAVRGMESDAADRESQRCLQCDLRLKITPVKFWGNY